MDDVLKRLMARLTAAIEERDATMKSRAAIVEVAKQELRDDLNEEEETEFRTLTDKVKETDEEIRKLEERVAELSDEDERSERAASAQRRLKAVSASLRVNEHRTYEADNPTRSYFLDLARAHIQGDAEARARIDRHGVEVMSDPEYRDLNRTDGTGGNFVPPAYLMEQFIALKRQGRATANAVHNMPLPGGTDSMNIPRLVTGTATAIQTADNAAVQETDATDGILTIPVRTIAGQQDVAIQLLDQSPVAVDQMLINDLVRDYNTKLNVQVMSGSGASGQSTGILTTGSIGTVAYTDATPTVPEIYPKIASAINAVASGIYTEPNLIIMHPRRWAWFTAALDSNSRPLVVPTGPQAGGAFNAMGTINGATGGIERVVGYLMGIPVITDPSIPTTYSAGAPGAGTEDVILVLDTNESYLWESSVKTRVLPDIGSGTLTVRLQIYGYVAFTAARYPASVAIVAGTGLIAPTF